MLITNSGGADIRQLTAIIRLRSAAGLELSSNAAFSSQSSFPLTVGQTVSATLCPPIPTVAGIYAGQLTFTMNGSKTQDVAITLTSRGPVFGDAHFIWLPLLLFLVVLAAGFTISQVLDQWFLRGGLARAEAIVAIYSLSTRVGIVAGKLTALAPLPSLLRALTLIRGEIDALQAGAADPGDLSTEVQHVSSSVQGAEWTAVVLEAVPVALRAAAANQMDSVALPTNDADLVSYRNKIDAAATTSPAGGGAPALTQLPSKPRMTSALEVARRIKRMAWLQRGLIWIVSGLAAYSLSYANNPAFGSLLDYATVFVWSLGLTQAGTQVLTQARWPAK
jgi:hypothetical protein